MNGKNVVKEYLILSWEHLFQILVSLDRLWYDQIYMPAYLAWKDKNESSVADGIITVADEVAQNLHLMPQTSGKTTGGNQILR